MSLNISVILYNLKEFVKIIMQIKLTLPPTTAEKKLLRKCRQMFETKCPKRPQGKANIKYLALVFNKLNLKFGNTFFILFKLSKLIVLIDKKNEIIIEFMPTRGVKIIRDINNTTEPTM